MNMSILDLLNYLTTETMLRIKILGTNKVLVTHSLNLYKSIEKGAETELKNLVVHKIKPCGDILEISLVD